MIAKEILSHPDIYKGHRAKENLIHMWLHNWYFEYTVHLTTSTTHGQKLAYKLQKLSQNKEIDNSDSKIGRKALK